ASEAVFLHIIMLYDRVKLWLVKPGYNDSVFPIAPNVHVLHQDRIASYVDSPAAHSLNRAIANGDVKKPAKRRYSLSETRVGAGGNTSRTIGRAKNRKSIKIEGDVIGRDEDHRCILILCL